MDPADRSRDRPTGRETDPAAAQVASGHARGAAQYEVFPIVRYTWLSISLIAPSWRADYRARAPYRTRTVSPSVSPIGGAGPTVRQTDGRTEEMNKVSGRHSTPP